VGAQAIGVAVRDWAVLAEVDPLEDVPHEQPDAPPHEQPDTLLLDAPMLARSIGEFRLGCSM
jgi:hypothetical protein